MKVRYWHLATLVIVLVPGGCNNQEVNSSTEEKVDIEVPGLSRTTICHYTMSPVVPYVEISVSDEALKVHSEHAGDIVPAPAEGCPETVQISRIQPGGGNGTGGSGTTFTGSQSGPVGNVASNGTNQQPTNALTPIAGSVCSPGQQTVADLIRSDSRLTHFKSLLEQTGRFDILDSATVTVFAPIDDAFAEVDSARTHDKASLNALVLYHVTMDGGMWHA